jgi:hypothetical protein
MQIPPITFDDISILLAVGAVVLLITNELSSPHYGLTNLTLNKKKIYNSAIVVSILFFVTVALKIFGIVFNI